MNLSSIRDGGPLDPLVPIVDNLNAQGIRPQDALHAAALLESQGWTDVRAVRAGYRDVFHMGEALHDATQRQGLRREATPPPEIRGFRLVVRNFVSYLRGMTFALPMLLLSLAVVTLHYSLISYVHYSTSIATAIGIGTIASFLVTGGFSQAIAHEGLFYLSQGLYALGRHLCMRFVRWGIVVAILGWVGAFLANTLLLLLPWPLFWVASLFYVLLAGLWLVASLLYMLEREPAILVILAVGVLVVWASLTYLHLPMMTSQGLGLVAVDLITWGAGLFYFARLERKEDRSIPLEFDRRWSAVVQVSRPFFLYGLVYFAFLFTDRLLAWSAPAAFHPYFLWFQNSYELGLDWALWTFVFPMGLIEVYVDAMFRRIAKRRVTQDVTSLKEFNLSFAREHRRTTIFVAITGVLTIIVTVIVLALLGRLGILPDPLRNLVTREAFSLAAPAYLLVAIALQNTLVLFSLNDPGPAVRAVAWSLAVDFVLGFLFSRLVGYQWAAVGLLLGSLTFAILAARFSARVVGRLDFNLIRLL